MGSLLSLQMKIQLLFYYLKHGIDLKEVLTAKGTTLGSLYMKYIFWGCR